MKPNCQTLDNDWFHVQWRQSSRTRALTHCWHCIIPFFGATIPCTGRTVDMKPVFQKFCWQQPTLEVDVPATLSDIFQRTHHRLHSSASPVLTATRLVNGNWQNSILTDTTSFNWSSKNLSQVITSATPMAMPHLVQFLPWGASGQFGEI